MSKGIFILLLLLQGFYGVRAQPGTWKELHNQAADFFKQGDYAKAIPVARQAMQAAAKESGDDHENYITSASLLADSFFENGDFDKAEGLYEEVLTRKKKKYGEQHEAYAATLLSLGILYYEKTGENRKAETVYTRYNEIIRAIKGEKSLEYATAQNTLANVYTTLDDFKKAEIRYTKAREIRKELLGVHHEDYLSATKNLGYLYNLTEQYHHAVPLLEEVVRADEKSGNTASEDHALTLYLLGTAFMQLEVYIKAETTLLKATGLYKQLYGEKSDDYAGCLNRLGLLYQKMNAFEKAKHTLNKSLELSKFLYGDTAIQYATVINNLGLLYQDNAKWDTAIGYYKQALGILEKNSKTGSEAYAILLNNLGQVYLSLDKNSQAENFFSRALDLLRESDYQGTYELVIKNMGDYYENKKGLEAAESFFIREIAAIKQLRGTENLKYLFLLGLQAGVYRLTGRVNEAEVNYIQIMGLLKKWVGEKDLLYAEGLTNTAGFYIDLGKYEKGLPLLLEASRVFQDQLGQRSSAWITTLNQIAMVYLETGQHQLALDLFLEMKQFTQELYSAQHKEYAHALARAGHACYKGNQDDKARDFFQQAAAILKEIEGENTTDYNVLQNNLALIYMEKEDYATAAQILEKTRLFFKDRLLAEPLNFISSNTNLGKAYMEMGRDREGEQLLRESVAVREQWQGRENARTILEKRTLADLYIKTGDYNKATGVLDTLTGSFLRYINNSFAILTEKAKSEYLQQHSYLADLNNSLLYLHPGRSVTFTQRVWGYQLLLKSLSLTDTRKILESIRQSGDTSLRELFAAWQTKKARLAYQYSLPESKRDTTLYSLKIQLEALERDLNYRSSTFGKTGLYNLTPLADLRNNMEKEEALVDFVRFEFYNKNWTDSIIYAAFIFSGKDTVPVFVPLFEEKQLQKILDSAGTNATDLVNNIYRGLEGKGKSDGALGAELYQLVWVPLEPYLKHTRKISYSPAGKLYGIAFHALPASPADSNRLLMDQYELQQYTSTRQVALRKEQETRNKIQEITLFGDAAFTMDSITMANSKVKSQNASGIYTPPNRGNRGGKWASLPGTGEEVKKIKSLFEINKISSQSFVQTTASEENLKALSGNSPQVLHIATHGFFLPEPDKKRKENPFSNENSYTLADDPLLRSGLILAGGNYAWSGKTPVEGVEDGIATAYEISQLDLSKTELVVLSACETALGDVKGSEGVFGLQRAFKMAGVRKMIVSLWQVPDKETAELMTSFYGYWLKGKGIDEAFAMAQSDMRKKYPPFYWAAFVLVK